VALLVDHSQGLAPWAYAVPDYFRDALDIRWTPRRRDGRIVYCWTQGRSLSFAVGDILFRQDGQALVQVEAAQPVHSKRDAGIFSDGFVDFRIYDTTGPAPRRTGSASLTQPAFLAFLISGILPGPSL
jgi:hypothetical protein